MSGTFYGKEVFDAQLIIAQMLCMQALFYLGLGLAYVLMDTLMGVPLSLDQFFSADVSRLCARAQARAAARVVASLARSRVCHRRVSGPACPRPPQVAAHTTRVQVFADGMGNRMAWATVFGAFLAAFFNTGLDVCQSSSPPLCASPRRAERASSPASTHSRARAHARWCVYAPHLRTCDAT